MCGAVDVLAGFVAGVAAGLAHEQRGEREAETGEGDAQEERFWSQSCLLGDEAGGEGGERDGAVPRGLVEAHGEATPFGADEVDLHDDRGRPGQALVHPEEDVGEDHPAPCGREDQDEGDG